MNASSLSSSRGFRRRWIPRGGILLLALVLSGCTGAEKKSSEGPGKGGTTAGLARLQFAETQQTLALFELVYSNAGSKEISDVSYAQGRFLMNDQGVFRFEQVKREPQRSFWVYFHPDRAIIVAFPKLKIAYRASPEILSGAQGERLVAAYDGLRMVLCLSNVWNDPERNSVEVASSGDSISLQQQGRPFRWNVDMDSGAGGSPITSMRARKGFSTVCSLERKSSGIQQFSRENKDTFMRGGAGQLQSGYQWSLILPGHSRQSDFVFTPYPVKKDESEKLLELFEPPTLDPSFQVQELTQDLILDWMGLR